MQENSPRKQPSDACPTAQNKDEQRQERQTRLAAELRENLKKRKAQARARRDNATKSAPSAADEV